MKPRDRRFLECLVKEEKVLVSELRSKIGSLNPAQNAFSLRKQGWDIRTGRISVRDRDGAVCHPGYYWLEPEEKKKALEYLKRTTGTADTAPAAEDNFNESDEESDCNHNKRREYDNPL